MTLYNRKKTKEIKIGNKIIGGNNPILIQSMNNTDTNDIKKTVKQINDLEKEGCEITRLAIKDLESCDAIYEIKKQTNIPIVADIHFDYRIALKAMDIGVDKLRINPGNIGSDDRVKKVVKKAKEKNIPIRIGVNSGSLPKDLLQKYDKVTPEAFVESAMRHVKILENLDFENIVISLKSSNVPLTIKSYELISEIVNYPLHIGITESGTEFSGSIKSAVGIGSLLSRGIGDTLRVSLTTDPVKEIICGKEILQSIGIRQFKIEFVTCPTCGRTEIDLIKIAEEVQLRCKNIKKNITVAIMGCAVNGPGEAREADLGIAGGNGVGLLFKKGEIIKKINENELIDVLIDEIEKF